MDSVLFQNILLVLLIGSFLIFVLCVLCAAAFSDRGICCRDSNTHRLQRHGTISEDKKVDNKTNDDINEQQQQQQKTANDSVTVQLSQNNGTLPQNSNLSTSEISPKTQIIGLGDNWPLPITSITSSNTNIENKLDDGDNNMILETGINIWFYCYLL